MNVTVHQAKPNLPKRIQEALQGEEVPTLPDLHKDPLDRTRASQAQAENLTLSSCDT